MAVVVAVASGFDSHATACDFIVAGSRTQLLDNTPPSWPAEIAAPLYFFQETGS